MKRGGLMTWCVQVWQSRGQRGCPGVLPALGGGVVDHGAVAEVFCAFQECWPGMSGAGLVCGCCRWRQQSVLGAATTPECSCCCVAVAVCSNSLCWGRRLPQRVPAVVPAVGLAGSGAVQCSRRRLVCFWLWVDDGDGHVVHCVAQVISVFCDELVFTLKVGCFCSCYPPPRGTSGNCCLVWISPILHLRPPPSCQVSAAQACLDADGQNPGYVLNV